MISQIFFSESWLVDPVQWPVRPILSTLTALAQTLSYAAG